MNRFFRMLVTLVVAAAAVAVVPATPVSASAGGMVCTASGSTTFSPGLTLLPTTQQIDFTISYSGCTSLTGDVVTSGSRSGSFTGIRGCLSIPPAASGTFTVTWNDGSISTVHGTSQSIDTGGQTVITLNGTVLSGRFAGDVFVEVLTQASLDLTRCLTSGVTSQTAIGALTLS